MAYIQNYSNYYFTTYASRNSGILCNIFSDKWSITKEQLLSDQGLTIAYLDGNEIITLSQETK